MRSSKGLLTVLRDDSRLNQNSVLRHRFFPFRMLVVLVVCGMRGAFGTSRAASLNTSK
jgi:hypothetical protein